MTDSGRASKRIKKVRLHYVLSLQQWIALYSVTNSFVFTILALNSLFVGYYVVLLVPNDPFCCYFQELEKFTADAASDGLAVEVVSNDIWMVSFVGAEGTLYAQEKYTLRVRFTNDYPMDSPEVVFVGRPPVHPHIYGNGHICLNILGEDWSPALTVRSVCLSVLSMMSSATEKKPPPDNDRYTMSMRNNPKQTRFAYHDDKV